MIQLTAPRPTYQETYCVKCRNAIEPNKAKCTNCGFVRPAVGWPIRTL